MPTTSGDGGKSFADTDLCVKCGLCLPHCPTYVQTLDENESPRGRLSLIQGWATGKLAASPKLMAHIDRCLLCRACESACPAYVPYGRLLDDFRGVVGSSGKPLTGKVKSGLIRTALRNTHFAPWINQAQRALSRVGLLRALGLQNLADGLPNDANSHGVWHGLHPAQGEERARAALFLGCTAELADAATVEAVIRLLTRMGVSVSVPPEQICCGAMAQHAGDLQTAGRLRRANLAAFAQGQPDTVISLASGCGAMLKEYAVYDQAPEVADFSRRAMDISQFVATISAVSKPTFRPLNAKAFLHAPCSLKNVMKSVQYPSVLLRQISSLDLVSSANPTHCCGAAGSYLLEHPGMANALRDSLLDQVVAAEPDYLLTSNVGCAMHLRAGLKQRGMAQVKVWHPVRLLERQLISA